MSMRFQLALNVRDLDEAVAYYEKLLGASVAKRKPGYANFAVDSPPIKLVLFEDPAAAERLNHVGFETDDNDEVEATIVRLEPTGVVDRIERDESCCWAKKSTVWSNDPQGLRWEFYKKQADLETFGPAPALVPEPEPERAPAAGCGCS
jgi:catechol 2,3-dioxygenase-like lactoylglutathione lyase family enzyme